MHFEEMVRMTVEWYKAFSQIKELDMYDFSVKQITEYTNYARERRLEWAFEKL